MESRQVTLVLINDSISHSGILDKKRRRKEKEISIKIIWAELSPRELVGMHSTYAAFQIKLDFQMNAITKVILISHYFNEGYMLPKCETKRDIDSKVSIIGRLGVPLFLSSPFSSHNSFHLCFWIFSCCLNLLHFCFFPSALILLRVCLHSRFSYVLHITPPPHAPAPTINTKKPLTWTSWCLKLGWQVWEWALCSSTVWHLIYWQKPKLVYASCTFLSDSSLPPYCILTTHLLGIFWCAYTTFKLRHHLTNHLPMPELDLGFSCENIRTHS